MRKLQPPEKINHPLSQQPPSKSWSLAKPPLFENLVGGDYDSPQSSTSSHNHITRWILPTEAEKVGPFWPLQAVPWGVATLRQPISNHHPPATALTYLIFVLFLDSLIALIELLFRLSTLFMLLTEDWGDIHLPTLPPKYRSLYIPFGSCSVKY